MPMDLSDAFCPENLDTFAVIRRKQTVNNFGEADNGIQRIPDQMGVVDAGDDNKIAIATDEQHFGKSISVTTPFRLRGVSEVKGSEFAPDLVFWHGSYFKVVVVEDYTSYGFGWVQAQCTSEDWVDPAPPPGAKKSAMDC
jgi:hypothetical protein